MKIPMSLRDFFYLLLSQNQIVNAKTIKLTELRHHFKQ